MSYFSSARIRFKLYRFMSLKYWQLYPNMRKFLSSFSVSCSRLSRFGDEVVEMLVEGDYEVIGEDNDVFEVGEEGDYNFGKILSSLESSGMACRFIFSFLYFFVNNFTSCVLALVALFLICVKFSVLVSSGPGWVFCAPRKL